MRKSALTTHSRRQQSPSKPRTRKPIQLRPAENVGGCLLMQVLRNEKRDGSHREAADAGVSQSSLGLCLGLTGPDGRDVALFRR